MENIAVLGQKINFMLDKKQLKGKVSLWCAEVFSLFLFFFPTGSTKLSLIHHMPLECVLWVHCHDERLLHEFSVGPQDWVWAVYIASGKMTPKCGGNNPRGISSMSFKIEILTMVPIFFQRCLLVLQIQLGTFLVPIWDSLIWWRCLSYVTQIYPSTSILLLLT